MMNMNQSSPRLDSIRRIAPELAVAIGALVLNAWSLSVNGYSNTYYAAAAKSMTTSWHNFIYGSYDVGGFITTDKPPFALWLQAASARVFGFSSWSLLLPSAVAGALAVWVLMLTVRRVWGRTSGLVAGVVFMLTPIVWAVSRSMNPDAVLMLTLVAAAWATERAVRTNRVRWSTIAGLIVGVGFLTKMLAAVVVAPALVAAMVLGISTTWRRSAAHVGLFTAMFVAVSGAWVPRTCQRTAPSSVAARMAVPGTWCSATTDSVACSATTDRAADRVVADRVVVVAPAPSDVRLLVRAASISSVVRRASAGCSTWAWVIR